MIIHDKSEFLSNFEVGDTYWTILTIAGKSIAIKEEKIHNIINYVDSRGVHCILMLEEAGAKLQCTIVDKIDSTEGFKLICKYGRHTYLSDTLNKYHGVCKTKAEAEEELARRNTAWGEEDEKRYRKELDSFDDFMDELDKHWYDDPNDY